MALVASAARRRLRRRSWRSTDRAARSSSTSRSTTSSTAARRPYSAGDSATDADRRRVGGRLRRPGPAAARAVARPRRRPAALGAGARLCVFVAALAAVAVAADRLARLIPERRDGGGDRGARAGRLRGAQLVVAAFVGADDVRRRGSRRASCAGAAAVRRAVGVGAARFPRVGAGLAALTLGMTAWLLIARTRGGRRDGGDPARLPDRERLRDRAGGRGVAGLAALILAERGTRARGSGTGRSFRSGPGRRATRSPTRGSRRGRRSGRTSTALRPRRGHRAVGDDHVQVTVPVRVDALDEHDAAADRGAAWHVAGARARRRRRAPGLRRGRGGGRRRRGSGASAGALQAPSNGSAAAAIAASRGWAAGPHCARLIASTDLVRGGRRIEAPRDDLVEQRLHLGSSASAAGGAGACGPWPARAPRS